MYRAVESVLLQSYPNIEIILVDNGSTDDTFRIMLSMQRKYPDKIRIFKELKKGAPSARNKGLREAAGEWVQFLDADDELLPYKIQGQIDFLGSEENIGIIIGNYVAVDLTSRKKETKKAVKDKWVGLMDSRLGITSANLFRKSALLAVEGWNETLKSSQEYELMFRILQAGFNVLYDDSISTLVYKQKNSISKSSDNRRFLDILNTRIELRRKAKNYLTQRNLYTRKIHRAYSKYVFRNLWLNKYKFKEYFEKNIKKEYLSVPLFYRYNRIIRTTLSYILKRNPEK
ncbi:Glycosyl transferase family 2 [Parapedobacter koreensis]|uniref:Glycosyl transferase family 2 n=1 Tax=Parapedobacter koreensis TaxID=332977 RepID=A0A1H7T9B6_9SPHI|nr:Glycosyl transferase family 2 [Parapedobacter koreensis]